MKRILLLALLLGAAMPALAFDYDDTVQPDLSGDRLDPDLFILADGENRLTTLQQGNAFGRDIDYFTIRVPERTELIAVNLASYDAEPGNLAFLGVQAGLTFTVDDLNATAGDLLGGIVFGAPQLGEDILPEIGMLPGSTGFMPPLGPGDYTFWLNQTGPPNESTLVFVGLREADTGVGPSDPVAVPALGPLGLVLFAGLAGLIGARRLRG